MPDLTILERLQALSPKVNSPERLAILQSYGVENYADAEFLNLIIEALKDLYAQVNTITYSERTVATYAIMAAALETDDPDVLIKYNVLSDENADSTGGTASQYMRYQGKTYYTVKVQAD